MQKLAFILITILLTFNVSAQNKYTISGNIKDASNGEELIGTTVIIKEIPNTGVTTNAYGFYSITLPEGKYTLETSYVGYKPFVQIVELNKNTKLNIEIASSTQNLGEVEITGEKKNENITKSQMGVEKLDIQEIKNIPVLFGEKDILKTLQLLPGIKSAGEGNSGFFVRGGSADQNLILLDEAPVYNASHLLGFFSTFNSDAIKDVTVYKGNMPAEYGGRLASVLDIKMNDGNNKKFGLSGGIGAISSRINIEGPIVKERGSFLLTARRTYADVFLKLAKDSSLKETTLYFYDLNAKANYRINDNNRLFLSGYFGRDVFGFDNLFGFNWGNATGTLRWNHLFNDKLFSNSSLIFSDYNYKIKIGQGEEEFDITSKIRDFNFKQDFQYYINANNELKFGANVIRHNFIPGVITGGENSAINDLELEKQLAYETAAYISDILKIKNRIEITYGLRANYFALIGPGDISTYDSEGQTLTVKKYNKGDLVKGYFNLEPRVSASYTLNEFSSVKASYTRNTQNLHLLSNSASTTPTDLWIPSSNNVKPEIADQISAGYFRNFDENKYEFSSEIYYKDMQNQIDYRNNAQLIFNQSVESSVISGIGRAYGIELFVKKKFGKLNGWVGYTLSKTERKFTTINTGTYFPARQDRTHEIAIVGIYEASAKWIFSATWVYNTGNAVTFPVGKMPLGGQTIPVFGDRNANRFPDYHRLDLGATLQRKKTEKFESSWSFSVYNAYARKNAFSISFRDKKDDPSKTEAVKLSLFSIIPSITYNFKFK
jgi:TonB dependent receptor/CarboxypepD_reg-like domain/TonB-dependent Receptor Plug Domain